MGRNTKTWLALMFFLIAFLAGSDVTEGTRDFGMTGPEVYHPQTFLDGIFGWPFKGWGVWGGWPGWGVWPGWGGGLCCGHGGLPGWGWGWHKAELPGQNDKAEGGADNGKFAAYYGGPLGQTP